MQPDHDYTASRRLLREPFPADAIDSLPKGGRNIDYVGHAQTTARLLDADPEWSWEPMGYEDDGQPSLARKQDGTPYGLWIRLTVCGVTRIGFGELPASKGADGVKEAIGDAIRNAAMRFGVALDLWAKGDLASLTPETSSASPTPAPEAVEAEEPAAGESSAPGDSPAATPTKKKVTKKRAALNKRFHAILGELGIDYEAEARHALRSKYGRTLSELTDEELTSLVEALTDDEPRRERFAIHCRIAAKAGEAA